MVLRKKTLTWSEEEVFACFSVVYHQYLLESGWTVAARMSLGCSSLTAQPVLRRMAAMAITGGCSQGVAGSRGSTFACFAQEQGLYWMGFPRLPIQLDSKKGTLLFCTDA